MDTTKATPDQMQYTGLLTCNACDLWTPQAAWRCWMEIRWGTHVGGIYRQDWSWHHLSGWLIWALVTKFVHPSMRFKVIYAQLWCTNKMKCENWFWTTKALDLLWLLGHIHTIVLCNCLRDMFHYFICFCNKFVIEFIKALKGELKCDK